MKMFSAISRQVVRSASRQQWRSFSSTPSVGAAAEVKKLGVIGAGQMVSAYNDLLIAQLT
jgi:3-hydroxybutyryl-CoA dehydrogenase